MRSLPSFERISFLGGYLLYSLWWTCNRELPKGAPGEGGDGARGDELKEKKRSVSSDHGEPYVWKKNPVTWVYYIGYSI
jgi:hypothetical protein